MQLLSIFILWLRPAFRNYSSKIRSSLNISEWLSISTYAESNCDTHEIDFRGKIARFYDRLLTEYTALWRGRAEHIICVAKRVQHYMLHQYSGCQSVVSENRGVRDTICSLPVITDEEGNIVLSIIYRVSQEEWTKCRESVPYVKIYRYNPKHICPKLNG